MWLYQYTAAVLRAELQQVALRAVQSVQHNTVCKTYTSTTWAIIIILSSAPIPQPNKAMQPQQQRQTTAPADTIRHHCTCKANQLSTRLTARPPYSQQLLPPPQYTASPWFDPLLLTRHNARLRTVERETVLHQLRSSHPTRLLARTRRLPPLRHITRPTHRTTRSTTTSRRKQHTRLVTANTPMCGGRGAAGGSDEERGRGTVAAEGGRGV